MMINGDHNVIPPVGKEAGALEQGLAKVRRGTRPDDAVEISGRTKAGAHEIRQPVHNSSEGGMSDTLQQVRAQLQERIRNGFYDNEEVLGSIASKMLDLFGL